MITANLVSEQQVREFFEADPIAFEDNSGSFSDELLYEKFLEKNNISNQSEESLYIYDWAIQIAKEWNEMDPEELAEALGCQTIDPDQEAINDLIADFNFYNH